MSSLSDGVYDIMVLPRQGENSAVVNGNIVLMHDGKFAKQFPFQEQYPEGEIGTEWWLTCYRGSGRVSIEYSIHNGKSPTETPADTYERLNWVLADGFNQSVQRYDGTIPQEATSIESDGTRLRILGAISIGNGQGRMQAMIRRFGLTYPRSLSVTNEGELSFGLLEGMVRPFTAHGVELEIECVLGELQTDWVDAAPELIELSMNGDWMYQWSGPADNPSQYFRLRLTFVPEE